MSALGRAARAAVRAPAPELQSNQAWISDAVPRPLRGDAPLAAAGERDLLSAESEPRPAPAACKIAANDPAGAEVPRSRAASWNGRRATAPAWTIESSQCGSTPCGRGGLPPLSTAASPVSEQSGRADAVTEIGVTQLRTRILPAGRTLAFVCLTAAGARSLCDASGRPRPLLMAACGSLVRSAPTATIQKPAHQALGHICAQAGPEDRA